MNPDYKQTTNAITSGGRALPLSLPRRFMCDLMRVSRRTPFITVSRRMHLGDLKQELSAMPAKVGWCALFIKAYSIVAARTPELRQSYLAAPSPHLYEHPASIASVAVTRDYHGHQAVLWGQFRAADQKNLPDIDQYVRHLQQAPVDSVSSFRRTLSLSRLPSLFRRAILWIGMNISGRKRVKYFGTFGLSTIGGLGATLDNMISPCPTNLTYGPIANDGSVDVRLIFDHRVIDGAPAAKALVDLESVLTGEIVLELKALQQPSATDSSALSKAA